MPQVGGAIKNVIAIAAGMCEGLGLGTNAMAALVTRGCSEMRRLTQLMGGEDFTVFGLSGGAAVTAHVVSARCTNDGRAASICRTT